MKSWVLELRNQQPVEHLLDLSRTSMKSWVLELRNFAFDIGQFTFELTSMKSWVLELRNSRSQEDRDGAEADLNEVLSIRTQEYHAEDDVASDVGPQWSPEY